MAVNTQIINEGVNLRDLVERDLGRPKYRAGNYDAYPCPLHREVKGVSLAVYADHWHCYGKCQQTGDAIAWMRQYHNLDFKQACEALAGPTLPTISQPRRTPRPTIYHAPPDEPPCEIWQYHAAALIEHAQRILWSDVGRPAREYLVNKRGLTYGQIRASMLGYLPGPHDGYHVWDTRWHKPDSTDPVRVPYGITIPHYADGHVWAVKVRRAAGPIKYQQISGGKKSLYQYDQITIGLPLVIVEGEFDAVILWQTCADLVSAVAIASASNAQINRRWWPKLMAPMILARFDDDAAGESAAIKLRKLSPAVRIISVPGYKDINDLYVAQGWQAVRQWIQQEITHAY